jgi:hypothetical protein
MQELSWSAILSLMPHDLSALAKNTGAVERWRKVKDGAQFLWLCFVYAQCFVSLRVVAGWSTGMGGLKESSVAHRLKNAPAFLGEILVHVLGFTSARCIKAGKAHVVRLIDATTLSGPGSVGTDWRLHAVYIPGVGLVSIDLTDNKAAESLTRGQYGSGDIVIGDQGYSYAKGMHYVRELGAHFVVRVYLATLKLLLEDGSRLNIQDVLDRADRGSTMTIVLVPLKGKEPLKARLVVRPLPADKAEIARKKLLRKASKKQRTTTPLAVRMAGYVVLLTTVESSVLADDEVFGLYPIRWQIELLFKRRKSLLNLDMLTAHHPNLVRTFCLAKLIEATIVERWNAEAAQTHAAAYPPEVHDSDDDQPHSSETAQPACSLWRLTVVNAGSFYRALLDAYPVPKEKRAQVIEAMREGRRRRSYAGAQIEAIHRRINAQVQNAKAA